MAHDCLQWPDAPGISPPSTAPLPDVPALILDGRLDMRTPLENGRVLARELPHARIVTVPGTGHDELDSDLTGCADRALKRFVDREHVGDPCHGKTQRGRSVPDRARRLDGFRVAPGTHGSRGRVVSAAIVSAIDARVAVLQDLYAGFAALRGGGLRGGSYELRGSDRLVLRSYRYLRSVRVERDRAPGRRDRRRAPARERPRAPGRRAHARPPRRRERHDRRRACPDAQRALRLGSRAARRRALPLG